MRSLQMKKIYFLMIVSIMACSRSATEKTTNRPPEWVGTWKAEWETPPESYPGIEDMEFYMNGAFVFTPDSLTVTANGYPGCIFNVDTLSHTQSWFVANDTLFLVNNPKSPGITYKIVDKKEDRVKLQLLEDIFVTLTR